MKSQHDPNLNIETWPEEVYLFNAPQESYVTRPPFLNYGTTKAFAVEDANILTDVPYVRRDVHESRCRSLLEELKRLRELIIKQNQLGATWHADIFGELMACLASSNQLIQQIEGKEDGS